MNKIILIIVVICAICSALVYAFRKQIDGVEEQIPKIAGGAINEVHLFVNDADLGTMTATGVANTYEMNGVNLYANDTIYVNFNTALGDGFKKAYSVINGENYKHNRHDDDFNTVTNNGIYNVKMLVSEQNPSISRLTLTHIRPKPQPDEEVPQDEEAPPPQDEEAPLQQSDEDTGDIEEPTPQYQTIEPTDFNNNSIAFINFTPYTFTELARVNESKPTAETQTQTALNRYASTHNLNHIYINPVNTNKLGTLPMKDAESQKTININSNLVTRPTKLINTKDNTYTGPKSNVVCINSAPSPTQLNIIRNVLTSSGYIVSTTQINNPNLVRVSARDSTPEARELASTLKTAYVYKLKK